MKTKKLTLTGRLEVIVKLPAESGTNGQEVVIEWSEIANGSELVL
jgi:hypothetical protein